MKKIIILVTALLYLSNPSHSSLFAQIQLGNTIEGNAADDWLGYSVALSADGNIMAVGAPQNQSQSINNGYVRIYEYMNGDWIQLGGDLQGEASADQFGYSISLSSDGNRIAIGAPRNDKNNIPFYNNYGHVRVYEYFNGDWVKLGSDIEGKKAEDESGCSVSLSADGNIVAIGALYNDRKKMFSGHVRIFHYKNGNWIQLGNDINGEKTDDNSGFSISLSDNGKTVAIGAPRNNGNGNNSGQVRVFQYTNGDWTQLGNDIYGENKDDFSGYSVSISANGKIVAIGAPQNDAFGINSGQVKIYQYLNNDWIQLGNAINGVATHDFFGQSISLSSDGSRISASATTRKNNQGYLKIYEYHDENWVQLGETITQKLLGLESRYSTSFSSNGKRVAFGAIGNYRTMSNIGQVQVFDIDTESPLSISAKDNTPDSTHIQLATNNNTKNWRIEWKAHKDFAPNTGSNDHAISNTHPLNDFFSALLPNTTYYIYYQESLNHQTGEWAGPYRLSTQRE